MKPRIDPRKVSPGMLESVLGIEKYLGNATIDHRILDFARLRASQMNGCAYCIDMHWKDLRAAGESEQRLYGLDAWRESPYYSEQERAALAWTEAVTDIAGTHAPDELYEDTRKHFSEREVAELTLAVATINLWNRLSIASRTVPGTYQPAEQHELVGAHT